MIELEGVSDQNLEMALKASRETTLNGHIHEANGNKCISVNDINITMGEVCHLCKKNMTSAVECDKNGLLKLAANSALCEDCVTPAESAKGPEKDCDAVNKRDSGFHTLKREETENDDTGQQVGLATSSASSSDSTVLIEGQTTSENNFQSTARENLPSIVVDECDDLPEQSDSTLDFDLSETVFEDDNNITGIALDTKESPKSLAEKLFNNKGYKRTEVSKHIGKNSEYSRQVGKEYLRLFDFGDCSLIDAYRAFLSQFALLGETQERERILSYFSERYIECNPNFLDQNPDSVHTLVCALTLLNTDLHSNFRISSGRKKMTYKQFATNLSGLMSDQSDFPNDLLVTLYSSIKKHPLPWGGKEQRKVPRSSSMRQNTEPEPGRTPTKIVNRSLSTRSPSKFSKSSSVDPSRAGLGRSSKTKPLSHNQGLLWRKTLLDPDGKKVPIGKRGWRIYTVTLQNLELHIVKRGSTEAKTTSIHHCLAEETTTDSRREYVFRLTLANSSVTLYQASSEKEARKWVRDINKAAALLSAAPLCSPIGSQLVFRRALLPSAPSTLPPPNQLSKLQDLLAEHEEDLIETEKLWEEEKSPSEQRRQYYTDKMAYLKFEIKKYKHYVKILQVLVRSNSIPSEESASNLQTTDNGSVVSVTPSEPPLASPSALDNSDAIVFPEPGDMEKQRSKSAVSSPAHLVSPQHRPLSLSPTSSLPNLSPILESPTNGPFSSRAAGIGSLQRRRRVYESSLNDGESPSFGNANNSNRPANTIVLRGTWSSPRSRVPENNTKYFANPNHIWNLQSQNHTAQGYPKVSIETTVVGVQTLPGNQEPFPVKRYEMKIADMGQGQIQPVERPNPTPNYELRTRLGGNSLFSDKASPQMIHNPIFENMTLSRVKGRKEKKGIERYSYMQAVSPQEET